MKTRFLGTLSLLMAFLTFFGCDDTTGTLGIEMLPGSDELSAHTTSFDVTTRSYYADAVYAKTSTGYVGRFSDPEFGYYETSFLTELNCIQDFELPEVYKETEWDSDGTPTKATGTMAGDSVTSVRLVVYYSSWFGDSLNACRMSAYEIDRDKQLDKNRYTNVDPKEYIQQNLLLGRKAYSAYDTSVPDSIRNGTDDDGYDLYYPNVSFPLDKDKFGEDRILKVYREHPEYFRNADEFIKNVFSGVYIKSDYGDGTILYIDRVDLQMQFRFHYVNDSTGVALKKEDGTLDEDGNPADSLYYSMQTIFASTKEVIQANQFLNSEKIQAKVDEKDWTYIKSPAGIFTEAALPYDKIYEELSQDTLNGVKLTFESYRQEDTYEFSMSAPSTVLLLRKQDLQSFFEENKVTDNSTSYASTFGALTTNQYVFSNISRLVTTCINEKQAAKKAAKEAAGSSWNEAEWENKWATDEETKDWDKVLLLPVTITYDSSSSSTMTAVENDLKPGYAKLKGGPDGSKLKLEVTYTRFNQ